MAEELLRSGVFRHYSSSHQILLVGEGDFSFALCLARSFGSASNIVATSLDSYESVISKYKKAKSNVEYLKKLGAAVLHRVDATKTKFHPELRFDRIIFNFPHAGFHGKEDDAHIIEMHRNLVQQFLGNASTMLRPSGEIHVNHKTAGPFARWNLEELANQHSLELIECIEFKMADYPGYNNKKGDGPKCDEPFPLGKCSTFKFILSSNKLIHGYNPSGLAQIQEMPFQNSYYCSSCPETQVMEPQIFHALQSDTVCAPLMIGTQNEFERIFDGYFVEANAMFGRTDYDYALVAQQKIREGFEKYMTGAPGRTVKGFMPYVKALHHSSKCRVAWLQRLLLT